MGGYEHVRTRTKHPGTVQLKKDRHGIHHFNLSKGYHTTSVLRSIHNYPPFLCLFY
jgi:hypothetical protein